VRQQYQEVRRLRERFARQGLRIFYGTECDILPDGTLDFDDEILDLFDYVVAAVHSNFKMDERAQTRRIVKALAHPKVTMLAHPTGRLLLQREAYAVDMPAVISAAARHGKLIELNAHPYRFDMDWRWWRLAAAKGVRCVINPDAHSIADLELLAAGVGIARKGWLTKVDVVNCLPAEEAARAIGARAALALSR